jgi:hypothetical protein
LFQFIIQDHVLHYVKLNPNQHGFPNLNLQLVIS